MAGGKGKRLHAVTRDEIPKPLAPVNGTPIIEWQIKCLRENDITEICIVIGHLGEKIREKLGNGSALGVKLRYFQEETPLGTAGALAYLSNFINGEDFTLVYGDCVFDVDIKRMATFHKEKKAHATLFVHPNSHPYDSDIVLLDKDACIKGILPKNEPRNFWYDNMVNAGLYILSGNTCNDIPTGRPADLEKEYITGLIPEQKVYGYHSPEYIKDAGTPERIKEVTKALSTGTVAARNLKNKQKCIFIDRDGTINHDTGLFCKIEELSLFPFAAEAFKHINDSGFLAIVVTNQPVIARGLCTPEDVDEIHKKMKTLLGEKGAYADAVYYCPHHPDKGYPEENPMYKIPCKCRKPGIGMIEQAMNAFNIAPELSWIIGDTTTDIQTGINAGLKTALVRTGEAGTDGKYNPVLDIESANLLTAVEQILGG